MSNRRNRRKNKGYRPDFSIFHHNSNKKSSSKQSPPGIVSDRQQAVMDVLIKTHQALTGDDITIRQIDHLSVRFTKALLKATINGSQLLEIDWLDWRYHITREWYEQCCPPEKMLSGLRGMTALTARAGRINASLARHH